MAPHVKHWSFLTSLFPRFSPISSFISSTLLKMKLVGTISSFSLNIFLLGCPSLSYHLLLRLVPKPDFPELGCHAAPRCHLVFFLVILVTIIGPFLETWFCAQCWDKKHGSLFLLPAGSTGSELSFPPTEHCRDSGWHHCAQLLEMLTEGPALGSHLLSSARMDVSASHTMAVFVRVLQRVNRTNRTHT